MTWHTCSNSAPTSSWKVYVSACWKVAQSFLPWGPAPTVPTQTCRERVTENGKQGFNFKWRTRISTWAHVWLTWDLLITWLASSWMENFTPSSEEKEAMGDRVPDVNTMLLTESLKSENAWKMQAQRSTEHSRKLIYAYLRFRVWGSCSKIIYFFLGYFNRLGWPAWQ